MPCPVPALPAVTLGLEGCFETGQFIPRFGQAFLLSVEGDRLPGDILWRGHMQDIGWQPYGIDGATAGTVGERAIGKVTRIASAPDASTAGLRRKLGSRS